MTTIPPGSVERGSVEQLRRVAEHAQQQFAEATADEVLAWAAPEFGDSLAVACSMASDTVLPSLVARHQAGVDVLFLQTGYHFPETLGTREALPLALDVNIIDLWPAQTVAEQDAEYGAQLHDRDPARCCQLRKVNPLDEALAGYRAWVTGVRREDNLLRAGAQLVEWDERHQMVKINPIVSWSLDDVINYATANAVPINPLLADGYPSIGCRPCTRRVAPGEDPRSGRWAGLTKTECGIHL